LASTDVNRTSENSSKDLSGINPVALTERMTVSEATMAALPVEVAIDAQEAAVVASASPGSPWFGPGADRMMIVEFSVLSPSEAPAAQPTVAAGAVAVGSLAHGSGASAGASRRSLLKL
jgi:hypothetical protein